MNRILRLSEVLNLIVLITITQTVFAQPHPLRFQHLSVDQGLSANMVYAITQDKNGFMWLATTDGLNRFDGKNVEIFRQKLGDATSLPDNSILCLYTDSRGIIWIGTPNGLARYDERTNSFRTFFTNPKDKNSLPSNHITVISADSSGLLWVGTGAGLCSFDVKRNRFHRYQQDDKSNSISDNHIRDIKIAPDGIMWIATDNGLNRLDTATMRFTSFFNDTGDSSTLSNNFLPRIVIDKDGNLWTGSISDDKLYLDSFNTKTYRCKRFTKYISKQSISSGNYQISLNLKKENIVRSLYIDTKGRLWIGSVQSGLTLFYPGRNIFHDYNMDRNDPDGMKSNAIFSIYQDHSGMIWLGTLAGADRFNPDESKFILYRSQLVNSASPDQKTVQAFAEDDLHRLWIGTSGGLFILDRITGKFSYYHISRNETKSPNANSVTAICRDRQGNMWLGTMNGLKLFDPDRNKLLSFYAENNSTSLASNNISSIVCDKNGDLLITGRPGFTIYYTQTHRFVNFKNDTTNLLNRGNNIVFEDKLGIIWLGKQGRPSLIKYDRKNGILEKFTKTGNDTSSLASIYVSSIAEDHKGVIWIATRAGLSRFNEISRTFTNYTDKNGLSNVRVKQLLVDDKDRIWMGTNRGISMLNESRTEFMNYDPADGLQGWEFSEPSAFKTHDGYFCYGGQNGFNIFHPDSIKKSIFIPPVILKGITIFDQPLKMDSSYSNLKSLRLSYKQNFFSFEFAALNYDHPEKNKYECQLVGFDKKMVQLGTNNKISYTNVPPAHYKLKVKASNNDNVWNEAGYELDLIITPPFWATWWFRTILVISFISAVFLFFKLRENRIRKEQAHQIEINKKMAEIRMTALRTQMNPHFIYNSLNAIKKFLLKKDVANGDKYLNSFAKLLRLILENSQENKVVLESEIKVLRLYLELEHLRFEDRLIYSIDVDEKINTQEIEIPSMILQPFVENAIVHGLQPKEEKGNITISFEAKEGYIETIIEDDGIGREKAALRKNKSLQHKSLAIKISEERLERLKRNKVVPAGIDIIDLKNEEGEGCGTRVVICIPLE